MIQMPPTPDRTFIYSEIIQHTTLELMTKLTEYPSPAKQEAKIEAQRRNAEAKVFKETRLKGELVLKKHPRNKTIIAKRR